MIPDEDGDPWGIVLIRQHVGVDYRYFFDFDLLDDPSSIGEFWFDLRGYGLIIIEATP